MGGAIAPLVNNRNYMAYHRAKRNMSFGGKLFDRGVCYELNESELKNLGIDFELVEGEKPKEPVEEPKAAKAEPKAEDKEEPVKEPQEQKAKRR